MKPVDSVSARGYMAAVAFYLVLGKQHRHPLDAGIGRWLVVFVDAALPRPGAFHIEISLG